MWKQPEFEVNALLIWTCGRLMKAAVVDAGNVVGTSVGQSIVPTWMPESMSSSKILSKQVA
eukprot:15338049-Ditylum_brightwellii.AAC.1